MKITLTLIILFLTYGTGLYTLYLSHRFNLVKSMGFATGVFLGAAFFHLLPDATQNFETVSQHPYPWSFTVCVLTIFLMLLTSRANQRRLESDDKHNLISGLTITIMLSLHSLIAGVSMGLSTQVNTMMILFMAIISHKMVASFALMMHLVKNNYQKRHCHFILIIFSLMTPLGIAAGSTLLHALQQKAILVEAIFNAAAAGTFIYIALFEYLGSWLKDNSGIFWGKVAFCFSGAAVMALLAIWI